MSRRDRQLYRLTTGCFVRKRALPDGFRLGRGMRWVGKGDPEREGVEIDPGAEVSLDMFPATAHEHLLSGPLEPVGSSAPAAGEVDVDEDQAGDLEELEG